jgi:hypothetical protein
VIKAAIYRLICGLLTCFICGGAAAQDQPSSPTITNLESEMRRVDRLGILDRFERSLAEKGTPLIEPATRFAPDSLVTFLWRAQPGVTKVYLVSEAFTSPKAMSRFPDTNLWYETFQFRPAKSEIPNDSPYNQLNELKPDPRDRRH